MFQRAAAIVLSCLLAACANAPEDQTWVVWDVQEVCPELEGLEVEEAWLGTQVEVHGATQDEFSAVFGGFEGDCSEARDDLRTCAFVFPLEMRSENATETVDCRVVLTLDHQRIEDPELFEDIDIWELLGLSGPWILVG